MPDQNVDPLFPVEDSHSPAPSAPPAPAFTPSAPQSSSFQQPAIVDVGYAGQPATPFQPSPSSHTQMALPKDADIDQLQQSVRGGYADITAKLLSTHKAKDAGEMGNGINQLMMAAKGLNPQEQKSSLFGKIMAKVQGEKEHILANTQSIQKRIAELTANLDQTANLMRTRIHDLEGMKAENLAHQQKLQTGLTQVDAWLQQINSDLAIPLANPQDMQAVNERKSIQHLQQRLIPAKSDLENALVLDQQQFQELQTTQDNARAILDEFDRVKNIAIPALTSLVAQQLIALEQQQAMKTDSAIRDMTNAAITQAAQTLGENQVQIANLQQQSVISVDTLTQAQDILDQADQKVREIQAQAEIRRKEDEVKRQQLEQRLLKTSANA